MRRNEPFEERPFDVDERAKNLIQDLAGMGGMSVEGLFYLVSINEIDLAVSELGWGLYNRQVKISSEHAAEFFCPARGFRSASDRLFECRDPELVGADKRLIAEEGAAEA